MGAWLSMASKRQVELEIQLKGAKSINDLDLVLKDINKELKAVDVNSDAFKQLSESAKKADDQLKSIKEDLRGISDEKKLDSVAKAGGALAASLSIATIAASKFGEQTSESVQKAIQTATELSVVVNSIKPIIEGLSSSNRKAFAGFVKDFRSAGIGAKLFGNTTRTAIASTGIGLLVVALGLLIANWDSVTKAVLKFGNSIPFIKNIIDGVTTLIDKVGSLSNLFSALGAGIKGLFTAGTSFAEEFNKALANGKTQEALEKQTIEILKQNEERERAIKLLEAQGKKELEIIELKKQSSLLELDNLIRLKSAGKELTEDQEKRIVDLQLELQLLDIQQRKVLEAIKKEQDAKAKQAAKEKADKLKAERELTAEIAREIEQRRIEAYKLEQEAQKNITQLRIDNMAKGAEQEIAQVRFNNRLRIAEFKGTQEQINEQTRLLIEKQVQEEFAIREKYRLIQKEKDKETKKEKSESDIEQFKADFEKIQPYIDVALEGIAQVSDAITAGIGRNLEQISLQLQAVDSEYQTSIETRKALEAQLADAQGIQKDNLLASIAEEQAKEVKLAAEKKKLLNEEIKQKNKQQQIEWANNLINSIVRTALAVVSALPIIPLSIAVGALGAVSTGIIAANKPEPLPTFAVGGFTSGLGMTDSTGHEVAGVVHANEYVIPANVLNTSMGASLASTLEAIRLGMPSFAVGGFADAPSITPDSSSTSISPESLKAIMESSKIYVSVQEVRDIQTNVSVIESRAAA